MKIVGLPFNTNVKCNRCGCEFEIDSSDVIYHESFTTYAKKTTIIRQIHFQYYVLCVGKI